jgi:hypothetical protein
MDHQPFQLTLDERHVASVASALRFTGRPDSSAEYSSRPPSRASRVEFGEMAGGVEASPWDRAGVSQATWRRAFQYAMAKHVEGVQLYFDYLQAGAARSTADIDVAKRWATEGLPRFWAVADGDAEAVRGALAAIATEGEPV